MQSRRDFLKRAAILGGLAGASGFVPESVQRAFAIAPDPGTAWLDAEHIVIMMQENRSFDHTLGTLQGVRGLMIRAQSAMPTATTFFCKRIWRVKPMPPSG